jgi:hypothetical protein
MRTAASADARRSEWNFMAFPRTTFFLGGELSR